MEHFIGYIMLGHKSSLNKLKGIESMFSGDNGMKLGINKGRKFGKFTNMWKF